jgi:hypothetical protein
MRTLLMRTLLMRTEMDYLVLGNHLLAKADQPKTNEAWHQEFALD